jgi:hypothetical protein
MAITVSIAMTASSAPTSAVSLKASSVAAAL